jgi:pyridoxal phosphate enzyme (YggS family)
MSIPENLRKLKSEIPGNVSIVAVSKRKSTQEILQAYNAGHRIFGENRVQELVEKQPLLPEDIRWHFVGHLQTNKVKYLVPFVYMIQSVDSKKLLFMINREAEKANRVIPCLLQVYIATEETKYGFTLKEWGNLAASTEFGALRNVRIDGVMGMATFTPDMEQVRSEFRHLHEVFRYLKENYFAADENFREISMGMSGDYHVAIEEGSTMIRLGTVIFGPRNH